MKTKLQFNSRLLLSTFVISIALIYSLPSFAQHPAELEEDKLFPPAEEDFQEATDLVVPWRSSGCPNDTYKIREPGCHIVTGKEWTSSNVLTLYNRDGSLWYRFSVNPKSPDYFRDKTKKGFLPFAAYPQYYGSVVILRLVGESPHWYKVEVNEETRATKFVLKSDPMWAKTKWSYWLAIMKFFKFDENQPPLLDKPNGQVIEESAALKFDKVTFLKADGDWAYVEGGTYQKTYRGWIRWRKGREMLVKDLYGLLVIQKPK